MRTTIGQILVNSALPENLKDYSRVLDKKGLSSLMDKVARDSPEKYSQVVYEMKKIGDEVATRSGSSFSLADLRSPLELSSLTSEAERQADSVMRGKGSSDSKLQKVGDIFNNLADKVDKQLVTAGHKKGNALANAVVSGARGNALSLRSTIVAPLLVTDHKQRPIPVLLSKSYAEGADPASYWAASYGTRQGVVSTKFATAEAGAFGKQLSLASGNLIVTLKDCGTQSGVPYSVDDDYNLGAYLAKPVGEYERNTLITPDVLAGMKKSGVSRILVRSPMTCEAPKGVCQKCEGYTEKNSLAEIGSNVGMNSAASLAEPIAQGGLNTKHTGGVVGGMQMASGFKLVNQLTAVPKIFKFGSTLAEREGTVDKISEAAQGGTDIFVGGVKHYAPPGLTLKVKVGDTVEAGNELSAGLVNPRDIVRLRGVGAGRLHLADSLKKAYDDTVQGGIHRRNFENVARALINHVQVDDADQFDGVLPDDIVEYQQVQKTFRPTGAKLSSLESAKGSFLAKPYLHYSIGTPVDNTTIRDLKDFGHKEVEVLEEPPPFAPVMLRLTDVPKATKDWQARLAGTNLQKGLLRSVHLGEVSDVHGISFVPGLAQGKDFGKPRPGQVGY